MASRPTSDDGKVGSGRVFLSYQWDSQKTVIRIRDRLVQAGYNVWFDLDNMKGDTLEAMAAGVDEADAVIICFSKKYSESKNCKAEARYAFSQEKPLIPLRMESGYKPGGWLGILLGTALYYDFSREDRFDVSIRNLIKALGETTKSCKDDKQRGSSARTRIASASKTKAEGSQSNDNATKQLSQLSIGGHTTTDDVKCPVLQFSLKIEDIAVEGVAELDDKIFVVCSRPGKVEVYDSSLKQISSFAVEGLKAPMDLSVDRQTRQLYIADVHVDNRCVWRVAANGVECNSWSTGEVTPWKLSMTSSRLLITPRQMGQPLLLFTAGGVELSRTQLPCDMYPQHAVETPNGSYIVCHVGKQHSVVSEVDKAGQVLREYTGQLQLVMPRHMAWCGSRLLLIEGKNSRRRIVLLTADLKLDRVVLDGLSWSERLSYAEASRKLILQSKTNDIALYQL